MRNLAPIPFDVRARICGDRGRFGGAIVAKNGRSVRN